MTPLHAQLSRLSWRVFQCSLETLQHFDVTCFCYFNFLGGTLRFRSHRVGKKCGPLSCLRSRQFRRVAVRARRVRVHAIYARAAGANCKFRVETRSPAACLKRPSAPEGELIKQPLLGGNLYDTTREAFILAPVCLHGGLPIHLGLLLSLRQSAAPCSTTTTTSVRWLAWLAGCSSSPSLSNLIQFACKLPHTLFYTLKALFSLCLLLQRRLCALAQPPFYLSPCIPAFFSPVMSLYSWY